MSGECKKLAKPIAVIKKRENGATSNQSKDTGGDEDMGGVEEQGKEEELEIVEIVRYKIVFSLRPEPISGVEEAG